MFGLDFINLIEKFVNYIERFFTIKEEKGGAGAALESMFVSMVDDVKTQAENQINQLPATVDKASNLMDRFMGIGQKSGLVAESTTGPNGDAPPATPPVPTAAPAKAVG